MHVVGRLSMGGLELEVIKLLNRLDKARYSSAIIATESIASSARELVAPEIKLLALNKGAGMQWPVVAQIAAFCREHDSAILHSHNWATMLYGVLAGMRARVPIMIHGEHGRETHSYALNFKQRCASRFLARHCDVITSVSDDIIPLLLSEWNVPPQKIVKMPIGVALHEFDFHADRRAAKARLQVPEEAFVLGTVVGNFRPVKDMPAMFRAFQLVQQKIPNALLLVAGGGNQKIAEEQAAEIGVAAAVKFLGERRDVARVMAAFDVYVNSSIYEGMSNAILEAMAAGAPVAATAVGGTPSIVRHEETGLLVPPQAPEQLAEALQLLQRHHALYKNIRTNARVYVEQHHAHDHYVQRHEQIYEACYARKVRASQTSRTTAILGIP